MVTIVEVQNFNILELSFKPAAHTIHVMATAHHGRDGCIPLLETFYCIFIFSLVQLLGITYHITGGILSIKTVVILFHKYCSKPVLCLPVVEYVGVVLCVRVSSNNIGIYTMTQSMMKLIII